MRKRHKSEQKIVKEANELAAEFYKIRGYVVREGYRFDRATHPQERECWQMAAVAYERLAATDIDDAVTGCEDEEDEG